MGHKKLARFRAIDTFENVLQKPEDVKGRWSEVFGNNKPIVLELACGKGEYTTGRASKEKDKNFIGIDIKGNRMYIGARKALEEKLDNVRFLRINIDKIEDYFAQDEVQEIWIIFPDPFLRDKKAKNRLTHVKFLSKYQNVLSAGGQINLKTDSPELYEFTLETLADTQSSITENNSNIYLHGEAPYPLSIKTFYEMSHLADKRIIRWIQFRLPQTKLQYVKPSKNPV